MSQGNIKTYGQKGSNMPFQLKTLLNLVKIADNTSAGGVLATEATLLGVLAALQNGQDFQQYLVMDNGGVGCPGACPTYVAVRIYDQGTQTFDPPIYFDAAGTLVVPVGPVQIVNPQYVLENVLLQLTSINAHTNTLGQKTMAGSMPVTIASDQTAVPVTLPTGAQVITSSVEVAGGTVTAGATSIGFTTDAAFTGTINGVARAASTFYTLEAAPGKTLPAVAFVVTAGSITIDKIV